MLAWCEDCIHKKSKRKSKICPQCKWIYPGQDTFKRKENKFEAINKPEGEKIMRPENYFAKVISIIASQTSTQAE